MLKWMVTLFIALLILSAVAPWLGRFGLGRLPGDLRIPARGRIFYVPFTTTVVLSVLVWLIGRII